jgi:hypothetical protein
MEEVVSRKLMWEVSARKEASGLSKVSAWKSPRGRLSSMVGLGVQALPHAKLAVHHSVCLAHSKLIIKSYS